MRAEIGNGDHLLGDIQLKIIPYVKTGLNWELVDMGLNVWRLMALKNLSNGGKGLNIEE